MRSDLGRIVGAEHVLDVPAGSAYNRDATRRRGLEGHADAVVLPADAQEVAQVLAWCYEHGVPFTPRGGGTGLAGGAVPTEGGVVCSLERLDTVHEVDPALWRLRAGAGVSTATVRRLARENGLLFGPDPGAGAHSTIGGNVATNAGGPHALKHGVTGRYVAGLQAVLAPGEIVRIGGWLSKDVAGYDLASLLTGSEGTLAVITEVSLRLVPAPQATSALVAFLPGRAAGCDAILEILAAGLRPSVLDFLDEQATRIAAGGYPGRLPQDARDPFTLIIELDGSPEQVAAEELELRELLAASALGIDSPAPAALWDWRDGIHGAAAAHRGTKVAEDIVLPLEKLAPGLEQFDEIATRHGLPACSWGHGGDGNVHANLLLDPDSEDESIAAARAGEELLAAVVALGGSIAGEHGIGAIKSQAMRELYPKANLALGQRIKQEFDPLNLLNPGKKAAL